MRELEYFSAPISQNSQAFGNKQNSMMRQGQRHIVRTSLTELRFSFQLCTCGRQFKHTQIYSCIPMWMCICAFFFQFKFKLENIQSWFQEWNPLIHLSHITPSAHPQTSTFLNAHQPFSPFSHPSFSNHQFVLYI